MRPLEDIVDEGIDLARTHSADIRRAALRIVMVFVIALALEVFLFNMNYFRSAGYDAVDMSSHITLDHVEPEGSNVTGIGATTDFRFTESSTVVEFHDLNKEVHNVHLDFDNGQAAQNLTVKISFTDAAHETYFSTTEYTYGVPETEVSTYSEQSQYLYLQSSGMIGSLKIEITNDDATYPVLLHTVVLNDPQPFDFNALRFFVVFAVLLLVCVFRPKSSIYRCSMREHPRFTRLVIVAATACEIVVLCCYLFFGSNQVGVATQHYNSGSWDGHSIVNTYQVGGDNAQQYAELARAMADGQLYLEEEPPQWLVDMDNPYDKGARDELQKQTGEAYLFDVAYYEGHYYVYFGVLPVLLFYLPFHLVTGGDFPTAIGVLVCLIAFVLGATALLDRFARHHFKRVSLGLFLLLQMPLVACSGMLYLAKFPTFYSLPIALALACIMWGLYFWMRGRTSPAAAARWYLLGSLCMALVAACRPQFLVFSLLAFPLFWRRFITERHLFSKRGALEFACLLAPYFVVAAGVMCYNHARFGSFFDFGANYNLTVNDMTQRGTNFGRFLPALFAYFLQPPTVSGVFPWIEAAPFDTTYLGQTIKEVTFGGILVCLPVLWILAFAKPILAQRFKERSTHTIWGVVVVMLVSGVIVACLDAQMAGILQRYTADYSVLFLMPAVLLAFIANDALAVRTGVGPHEGKGRRALVARDAALAAQPGGAFGADAAQTAPEGYIARAQAHQLFLRVLQVLVFVSVLYSTLVCFIPETGWYSDVYGWAYQDLIEAVEFWA